MNDQPSNNAGSVADAIASIIEKAACKAMLICFAIKFLTAISVYALLKKFINDAIAELWMTVVFAYVLYSHEHAISTLVKVDIMNKILDENNIEKDENYGIQEKDSET